VSPAALFGLVHALLGTALLVFGGAALLARKSRRSRHPRAGELYFWTLAAILATGLVDGVVQHGQKLSLLELLIPPTFACGLVGYLAVKRRGRWLGRPWLFWHIVGQSTSYVLVVVVFLLQTLVRAFPASPTATLGAWLLPLAVGVPLVARALRRWRVLAPGRIG
jgi:hypothetical protein